MFLRNEDLTWPSRQADRLHPAAYNLFAVHCMDLIKAKSLPDIRLTNGPPC